MNTKTAVLSRREILVDVLGVVSFVALTIAGAYIRVPLPFTPVPITLQTFFVIMAGAVLGKRLGLLSQSSYLLIGIFGLPVFTGGLFGFARLFGPTGGYLVGFILAAYLIGRLLGDRQNASYLEIAAVMLIGDIVLFAFGTVWLGEVMRLTLFQATLLGIVPFIPSEIIKVLAAATIYQRFQRPSRETFSNA